MTNDEDIHAEVLTLVRNHGDDAPRLVAERTVALNLAGDEAGVRRFRQIAVRLDELRLRAANARARAGNLAVGTGGKTSPRK